MTWKDLQRLVQAEEDAPKNIALQKLKGKPFWIWEPTGHKEKHRTHKGNCCFNHIIGLPKKDGIEKPMFDYEGMLYRALLEPGLYNSKAGSDNYYINSETDDFGSKVK